MSLNKIPFHDIKVSTKTVIIYTNLKLKIDKIYKNLPITEYEVVKKKRGRKKKGNEEAVPQVIPEGSIVTLKYENEVRGVLLKEKKAKKKFEGKKKECYFRNSLTIVTYLDGKMINYKVSDNGRLQVTGCKTNEQAVTIFHNFVRMLEEYCKDMYSYENELYAVYRVVMTNIDFNIGFFIDREALDNYINDSTEYKSLLETSFGYQGVNIKVPLELPKHSLVKEVYKNKEWTTMKIPYQTDDSNDFLSMLTEKERKKEVTKTRYNTFLVFNSGIIIMSSMSDEFMEPYYNMFVDIMEKNVSTFKDMCMYATD
jgi:hypothetical protein